MSEHASSNPLRVALVAGEHPFDAVGLLDALYSVADADIRWYPQSLENWAMDEGDRRSSYDVTMFYHFHQRTPGDSSDWWAQGIREALEDMRHSSRGVFLLHHAILAFPQWRVWSDVSGLDSRVFDYHPDEDVLVEIVDPRHPITKSMGAFRIIDETYTMGEPRVDSNPILRTRHPNSMQTIAWTRSYGSAPVFCYQSGHDSQTFESPHFRAIVRQGLQWLVSTGHDQGASM